MSLTLGGCLRVTIVVWCEVCFHWYVVHMLKLRCLYASLGKFYKLNAWILPASLYLKVRAIFSVSKGFLGRSPIWGTTEYFDQFLSSSLTKVVAVPESITILEDPQVELHLLRSCLGSCKIVHLFRTVPFTVLCSFLEQFGLNLKSCLGCIIQCSHPCAVPGFSTPSFGWSGFVVFLPICCCGFFSNSIRLLVSQLLSIDFHNLTFLDEELAVLSLKNFLLIYPFPLLLRMTCRLF